MIFYFSGTGNSKHIADKIVNSTGERLVFMSESIIGKKETYEIGEDESVGFIFPVYWYCMPTIVEKFITELKLSGYQKQYVYAIVSYGIAPGNVMGRFIKTLSTKQIPIDGVFGVKMIDNHMFGFQIVSIDKQKTILDSAEVEIDKIISMIGRREKICYITKGKIAFLTPVVGYAYRKTKHAKKFSVTKDCNGCEQCEKSCPCNVIHIVGGQPKWEGDCTFCLNCIHGCKQSAIRYGKFLKTRTRYQYGGQ